MDFELILLCLAAVAAGAINSVAGGGTLITFPVLAAVLSKKLGSDELAAVVANQTNTLALAPGSIAAAWGYRRELTATAEWLKWLAGPCVIGSVVGALLITQLPASVFDALVPWLIFGAAMLFALQPQISRWVGLGQPHERPSGRRIAAVIGLQFLVAVYGGYFGAGIGILTLAALALMGLGDIHSMNALKNVLAAIINATAIVIFCTRGQVDWSYAWPMIVSTVVGGYLGAAVALTIDRGVVRRIVVVIGFSLAAYYFYREWSG